MSLKSALLMTVQAIGKPWPHDGAALVVQRSEDGERVVAKHGNRTIQWDAAEYDALCLWLWMQLLSAALTDDDE